jgi:hypothetical protein
MPHGARSFVVCDDRRNIDFDGRRSGGILDVVCSVRLRAFCNGGESGGAFNVVYSVGLRTLVI